ncbi:hypothetical protein V6R21_04410 [Limibacter armeniacum]|uniref:hypothetical protein n=1 Tax=Limibacter armeniacum TaxID=466084 RepID=UPI002FE6367D
MKCLKVLIFFSMCFFSCISINAQIVLWGNTSGNYISPSESNLVPLTKGTYSYLSVNLSISGGTNDGGEAESYDKNGFPILYVEGQSTYYTGPTIYLVYEEPINSFGYDKKVSTASTYVENADCSSSYGLTDYEFSEQNEGALWFIFGYTCHSIVSDAIPKAIGYYNAVREVMRIEAPKILSVLEGSEVFQWELTHTETGELLHIQTQTGLLELEGEPLVVGVWEVTCSRFGFISQPTKIMFNHNSCIPEIICSND